MPLRAVLIDAFGTVVHIEPWRWTEGREPILRRAWEAGLEEAGARREPFDAFAAAYERARARQHAVADRELREFNFAERFAEAYRDCGVPSGPSWIAGARAARVYHDAQADLVAPFDDPHEPLAALRDAGFALALVSNHGDQGALVGALDRIGLRSAFDAFVVSSEVGFLKPHPLMFRTAVSALSVRPEEAVMVGNDPECDVGGARKAGLRTVWTPYPRSLPHQSEVGADAVARSLADLPGLLAGWSA